MSKSNTKKSFRAAYLINRYLQGNITAPEIEELEMWLSSSGPNRQLFEELCSAEEVERQLQQFENADGEASWQRLQQKMSVRYNSRQAQKGRKIWWPSVAALLVISVVAWQVVNLVVEKPTDKIILTSHYGADVLPGLKRRN